MVVNIKDNLFIQKIFVEHLLCTKNSSGYASPQHYAWHIPGAE